MPDGRRAYCCIRAKENSAKSWREQIGEEKFRVRRGRASVQPEPMSRSSVTLSSINIATISSMAGNTLVWQQWPGGHGQHTRPTRAPKNRRTHTQPNDIERAEAQRKPQQRAEIKFAPKPAQKRGKSARKENTQKATHRLQAALGKKGVSAGIEGKTQSKNEHATKDSSKDQAIRSRRLFFLRRPFRSIRQRSRQQADLLEDAGGACHISHESSSSCGRSCRPGQRSKENLLECGLASARRNPARNSSSEPCATRRPYE